jgi:hypothetical protein
MRLGECLRSDIFAGVMAMYEVSDILLDATLQFASFYDFEVLAPLPLLICLQPPKHQAL